MLLCHVVYLPAFSVAVHFHNAHIHSAENKYMTTTGYRSAQQDSAVQLSRLTNGLLVASVDCQGPLASLGFHVQCGSRWETETSSGCSHFLETIAFQSTKSFTTRDISTRLQRVAAHAGCSAGREHIMYQCDVERKSVDQVFPLLSECVTSPLLLPRELCEKQHSLQLDYLRFANDVDAQLSELIHTTSWGNSALGNPLNGFRHVQQHFNTSTLQSFRDSHFTIDRVLLCGVNINHAALCRLAEQHTTFPPTIARRHPSCGLPLATYTGGVTCVSAESPLVHISVAFRTPRGWTSPDLVPLSVLQTLLGGGGSFSMGGPGKGMYSRLYVEVLCSYWVESCVAFSVQYTDDGLFGMYITGQPHKATDLLYMIAHQYSKLGHATDEELSRAKNALKATVLSNMESRSYFLDDIARQLTMHSRVMPKDEVCQLIDAVTVEDLRRVSSSLLSTHNPTVVAYGNISHLPPKEALLDILGHRSFH